MLTTVATVNHPDNLQWANCLTKKSSNLQILRCKGRISSHGCVGLAAAATEEPAETHRKKAGNATELSQQRTALRAAHSRTREKEKMEVLRKILLRYAFCKIIEGEKRELAYIESIPGNTSRPWEERLFPSLAGFLSTSSRGDFLMVGLESKTFPCPWYIITRMSLR